MLKAGKSKPMEAWPKARRVSESRDPRALGSDESDNEDRIPVPAFQDSFGSAIQQAFDNMSAEKGKFWGECITGELAYDGPLYTRVMAMTDTITILVKVTQSLLC